MIEHEINPVIWCAERQLDYPPVHFITATTPLTEESNQWVLNNLCGRFSIIEPYDFFLITNGSMGTISFEDPKEATLFELKWS